MFKKPAYSFASMNQAAIGSHRNQSKEQNGYQQTSSKPSEELSPLFHELISDIGSELLSQVDDLVTQLCSICMSQNAKTQTQPNIVNSTAKKMKIISVFANLHLQSGKLFTGLKESLQSALLSDGVSAKQPPSKSAISESQNLLGRLWSQRYQKSEGHSLFPKQGQYKSSNYQEDRIPSSRRDHQHQGAEPPGLTSPRVIEDMFYKEESSENSESFLGSPIVRQSFLDKEDPVEAPATEFCELLQQTEGIWRFDLGENPMQPKDQNPQLVETSKWKGLKELVTQREADLMKHGGSQEKKIQEPGSTVNKQGSANQVEQTQTASGETRHGPSKTRLKPTAANYDPCKQKASSSKLVATNKPFTPQTGIVSTPQTNQVMVPVTQQTVHMPLIGFVPVFPSSTQLDDYSDEFESDSGTPFHESPQRSNFGVGF